MRGAWHALGEGCPNGVPDTGYRPAGRLPVVREPERALTGGLIGQEER